MKIVSIVGARPQFIKAGTISREIKKYNNISEIIIHTGQHFDENMSKIFFNEMDIPIPKYNLDINGKNHGAMTGQMLEKIEELLIIEKPDWVIIYGDTDSTLAGALAASKLHIKIAHIEAGLRSYNMKMPEEINRIVTDRISDVLFCPTKEAIVNLKNEGYCNFNCKIVRSGDVMYDGVIYYKKKASKPSIKLKEKYILCTVHRAENTDNLQRLSKIFKALNSISLHKQIVLPLHPRTKKILESNNIDTKNLKLIDPVGYLEMVWLINNSEIIMTDSGGLQKEAFFFNKYCITLRDETEWVELVDGGYNILTGADSDKIINAYNTFIELEFSAINEKLYGDGNSSELIIKELLK